ncbi:MAG: hypothetical protein OWU84_03475 [Firmicutes bacterium]|nr:hypothetical protein [Bacillota bacterium]
MKTWGHPEERVTAGWIAAMEERAASALTTVKFWRLWALAVALEVPLDTLAPEAGRRKGGKGVTWPEDRP